MSFARITTTALLDQLLNPSDEQAWRELDTRFRPILHAFTRRMGLSEADADDVTQESLLRFVKAYRKGQYDRARGRLSSWLISIAENVTYDLRQSGMRRIHWRGESKMGELSENDALEAIWNEECRRVLLDHAMDELRRTTRVDEKTIRAFELVSLEQRAAAEVAAETGISLGSVYVAKHRCLTLLREILARLNEVYEIA